MDRLCRQILADTPAGRAYLARIDREKAAARSRRKGRAPRAAAPQAEPEEIRAARAARVRREVWERARIGTGIALCECGCGRAIFWETFQMDHWLGAAKRAELTTAENCWALHRECHADKGGPDVAGWNVRRLKFCLSVGIPFVPRKPTRYYAQETSR